MNQKLSHSLNTSELWAFAAGLGALVFGYFQTKCNLNSQDVIGVSVLVGTYIVGRSWVRGKAVAQPPVVVTTAPVTKTTTK